MCYKYLDNSVDVHTAIADTINMDTMTQRYVTLTTEHQECKPHPQVFAAKSISIALPEAQGVEVTPGGAVTWQQMNYTRKAMQTRRGRLNRAGRRWIRHAMAGKPVKTRKVTIEIVQNTLP